MKVRLLFPSGRFSSSLRSGVATFAFLALTSAIAWGQAAGTGSITGTITDPAGAIVPGASVVVHNVGTGVDSALGSNDAGIYTAAFLQPGPYEVTVSKAGFTNVERKGLTVEVGRTLTINFALTVKAGSETISVVEEAPVVDTDKTEVSQVVTESMVTNLPLVGRRWDNLVLLTPGTTADGGLVSYRGISGLYNNNSVDGANNNQAFFSEARGRSSTPYTYSMDAIQEFQVATSNYSAEFGQAAGGIVNAVTKSGTNVMHGDLFYFLRYPTLNALDPVNKANNILTQPVHQQQQFGGTLGGAIIKDKLFYFVNYEGFRKVFPVAYTSTSTFPLTCPTALTAGQCGAVNSYLSSLLGAYARTGVNDLAFAKLDYQLNSRNRLSANFDWDNYHAPNSYDSGASYNNTKSITTNGFSVTHTRFVIAKWDATITSNMLNNIRFQWAVDKEIQGANGAGPSVTIASVMAYGMPNALPRPAFPDEHRLQVADTLSWLHGKHQIKAGFDFNRIHELLINLFQGGGIYNYSGSAQAAFNNWALDTYGINTGDGLTGKHYSSFTQVTDPITGVGRDEFNDNDFAGFVEDTWKARPNLTLNLGLRYEIQMIPQPPRPNTSTPLNSYLTSYINTDSNNWAPRIGIAWEPIAGTVVRAGYGMFYAKSTNSTFYTIRVENGVFQQTYSCSPVSTAPNYCPQLTFPNLIFTPPGAAPQAPFTGALTPQVTTFVPPAAGQLSRGLPHDFVNPLVHEGDVTIEQRLPGNSSLTAAWLFSRGLHLPVFVDANLGPASTTHTYGVLDAANNLQQSLTLPFYRQVDRIDNGVGDILAGYSVVNSLYNALALTYHRRMTNGVEALLNYTFSKSTDDGAVNGANGTFNGTDYTIDPRNQKGEYSVSDLYQKHRFTGSLIFQPTVFHNLSNRFGKAILDGYMFSGTITVASPLPVFALVSGFPSGGADFGLTGGTVTNTGGSTGGRPPQVSRNAYFGRTQVRDVDVRVTREFPLVKERVRLQFLGEAFNVFNHSIISTVNGTAYNYSDASATSATCPISKFSGCIAPNPTFLRPTGSLSTNGLYGARQLQFSAKIVF